MQHCVADANVGCAGSKRSIGNPSSVDEPTAHALCSAVEPPNREIESGGEADPGEIGNEQ